MDEAKTQRTKTKTWKRKHNGDAKGQESNSAGSIKIDCRERAVILQ